MPKFRPEKQKRDTMDQWKPPIVSVEKVDKEAYKIIFEEAKARFEECASESEAITERSIKMLFGLAAIGAFCIGQFTAKGANLVVILSFGVLMFLEGVILVALLKPRLIFHRGLEPITAFPKELDEEKQEEQVLVVYHELLRTYQIRINNFYLALEERGKLYKVAIILGLGILAFASILIGQNIISHPSYH